MATTLQESTSTNTDSEGLKALRSTRTTQKLNQIDRVRATGIGDHISLPQLVVCGDQSAGKSSVLEGITGIPFPRQDGVCTKFATEIILRNDPEMKHIKATIISHGSRSEQEKERLHLYKRDLADFSELPSVISDAASLMHIRGHNGIMEGPAFGADVLRIEVVGDTGLHLTVVDLPGLISVASEEQTEADIKIVADLVDGYLESSRTIILAVVQATNDIANQKIIQRARKFDKDGLRTVGIITKADLINRETEPRIALLAKNEDTTKLKLGWFLLKNPTPAQLNAGISVADRKWEELEFFSSGAWKVQALDMSRVGIESLRTFLQELLERHIERELPKVKAEIKRLLLRTENELSKLGEERSTAAHIRMFLMRLSMKVHDLVQAGIDGNYQTSDMTFFNEFENLERSTRLRAEVHRLNGKFSTEMRENSETRKISYHTDLPPPENSSESKSNTSSRQILVSKDQFDNWIKQIYFRTRGRELPGNYNHALLSELFREQSSRWAEMAINHVNEVSDKTKWFVDRVLSHMITEERVRGAILKLASSDLEGRRSNALEELQKLIDDEKLQPITYNHYYTDNIQNARQDSIKNAINNAMIGAVKEDGKKKSYVSNNQLDSDKLLSSLQRRVVVNMDDQACSEAHAALTAYYKVASKTFVDNVCRQVIERHILFNLADIFSPPVVLGFSDTELVQIASEPISHQHRREELGSLIQGLRDSLKHLA